MRKESLELWSWVLQRISAAFLVVGLFVHFWVLHYIDSASKPVTFELVAERLRQPGWIIFDSLLLIAVVYHGLNGIWSIVLDWNPGKTVRQILGWGLSVIGVLALIIGIYTLIPFAI